MLKPGQQVIFDQGGEGELNNFGTITKVSGKPGAEELEIRAGEDSFIGLPASAIVRIVGGDRLVCLDCTQEVTVLTNETVLYRYQVEDISTDGTLGEPDWDEPQLEEGVSVNKTWCECGCAECPWEYDQAADTVRRKNQ